MATISGEIRDENNDLLADCVVRAYRRDTGVLLVAGVSGDDSPEETGDADFASVVLLLHCDGADGSTTFTDSSGTPKIVTANGDAHIETDQSQFGGASGQFDGTGDSLSIASHADFGFGTGDFTIEFWVRPGNVGVGAKRIIYFNDDTLNCDINNGTIYVYNGSVRNFGSVAVNTWYHVAYTRSSGTLRCFLDGVSGYSGSDTTNTAARTLTIGAKNTAVELLTGYIDELRITKGVARYTANFTPPAAAFLGATIPAKPLGEYTLTTSYTGEVQVIALDPAGGTTFNDLILRTTPV